MADITQLDWAGTNRLIEVAGNLTFEISKTRGITGVNQSIIKDAMDTPNERVILRLDFFVNEEYWIDYSFMKEHAPELDAFEIAPRILSKVVDKVDAFKKDYEEWVADHDPKTVVVVHEPRSAMHKPLFGPEQPVVRVHLRNVTKIMTKREIAELTERAKTLNEKWGNYE